ncbi:uncharacterized protein LOC124452101 [Xenia sp. Carnegie-2017]|uniref:uncharacterized protein LOC124452101 n=1 Tax=Xenia sp. Carnegie-2017 TaxID=2897299 RepID=UPI001F03427D|nr:uncharacterized protein LOC124452101 [Xenia sp. Carnegie-2017]
MRKLLVPCCCLSLMVRKTSSSNFEKIVRNTGIRKQDHKLRTLFPWIGVNILLQIVVEKIVLNIFNKRVSHERLHSSRGGSLEKVVILVNNREEDMFPDKEISSIFDRNVFGTENCSFEVNPVDQEINVAKTTQNISVFVGERSQRNVFSSFEQTGDGSYRNQTSEIEPYHQGEPDFQAMQLDDSLLVNNREEDLFPDEEISSIFDRNVFGTENCSFEVNPVDQEINVAKTTQNISVFVGERSQRNVFSSLEQTYDRSYRNQTSEIKPYHQGETDYEATQLGDSLLVRKREEDLFPDEEISLIFDRNVFGTEICSFEGIQWIKK